MNSISFWEERDPEQPYLSGLEIRQDILNLQKAVNKLEKTINNMVHKNK